MRNKLQILSGLLFLSMAFVLLSILLITSCTPSLPVTPSSPATQPSSAFSPTPPSVVGNYWQKLNTPSYGHGLNIKFINADTGVILGDTLINLASTHQYNNIILKTFDGGKTWDSIYLPITIFGGILPQNIFQYPYNPDILFLSTSNGLYRSKDGGYHWLPTDTINKKASALISFINPVTGISSGNGLLKTTDSGNNFIPTYSSVGYSVLQLTNSLTGYAAGGSAFDGSNSGILAKTTTAGSNWYSLSYPLSQQIYSMSFINDNIGYISVNQDSADFITTYKWGTAIYKTVDGGASWSIVNNKIWDSTGSHANSIFFKDEQEGFFTGITGIYHTKDGGKTWLREYASGVHFCFPDTHTGYAYDGNGNILKRQF